MKQGITKYNKEGMLARVISLLYPTMLLVTLACRSQPFGTSLSM